MDGISNYHGIDDHLDDLAKPARFSPPHCQECGRKADKYYDFKWIAVCENCLRPNDKRSLSRKKLR